MTELKGKQLSLASKIAAVVFAVVMSVLSWVFGWQVPVTSILLVSLFIAFAFGTVDISLIAANIFAKKLGE